MRRLVLPTSIAVLAAALITAVSSASSFPAIRTAFSSNRHVVVTFSLGDLTPDRIVVANRPGTSRSGELLRANIRLNEVLRSVKTATGYRARTRNTLPRGTYYVQISGTMLGTDCTPHRLCPTNWSNVHRVRIT